MTYADMITLLLCFFAVFLSVSVPKKDVFDQARKEVIQQFGTPEDTIRARFPVQNVRRFNEEEENMNYDSMPSIVDHFDDNKGSKGSFSPQKAGDRIVTLEMSSAAFFASGSATMTDSGKKILDDLNATTLSADKYKDYVITVEGHTDDNPIATSQFPSNWELSTSRASAVVKYLLERGVQPSRLRASGYADTFPKVPNRDAAGKPIPGNQAQNRRVIIKLERIDKG